MKLEKYEDMRGAISDRSAWILADDAGVHAPEFDTEGAGFLDMVRNAVLEHAAWALDTADHGLEPDPDDLYERVYEGAVESIGGSSYLIYTLTAWEVFTDLHLWDEVDEIGADGDGDMTQQASSRIYQVGSRLVSILANELADALREDIDNNEDEEV